MATKPKPKPKPEPEPEPDEDDVAAVRPGKIEPIDPLEERVAALEVRLDKLEADAKEPPIRLGRRA